MAHPDVIDDIGTREDMPVSYTFSLYNKYIFVI